MTYQLIVFDFDGTLANSFPWFTEALQQLAQQHGFKQLQPHEIEALRSCDARTILKSLQIPFWKVPRIAAGMRTLMRQNITRIQPFAGAQTLLTDLSRGGAVLGLVSSNSFENVQVVLGPEVAQLFRHRQCGVSLFGKASQLKKLLRQSRLPADQAIYIGDEFRDLDAARAVGIRFGAVAWGYTQAEALKSRGPDHFFTSLREITTTCP